MTAVVDSRSACFICGVRDPEGQWSAWWCDDCGDPAHRTCLIQCESCEGEFCPRCFSDRSVCAACHGDLLDARAPVR